MFRKMSLMIAAAAMLTVPATATIAAPAPAPAKALSLRASTPVRNVSRIEGDSGLVITAVAVVAGLVAIVLVTDDEDDADSN